MRKAFVKIRVIRGEKKSSDQNWLRFPNYYDLVLFTGIFLISDINFPSSENPSSKI